MITTKEVNESILRAVHLEEKRDARFLLTLLGGMSLTMAVCAFAGVSIMVYSNATLGTWIAIMVMVVVFFGGLYTFSTISGNISDSAGRAAFLEREALVKNLNVFTSNIYGVSIPRSMHNDLGKDITKPFLTRTATGEVAEAKFALFENNWVLLINGREAPRLGSVSNGQEFWTEENKAKYLK